MRYYVYPYKQGSKSARAIANALGGRVLRRQEGAYKPRVGDVVINWGCSSPERDIGASRLLNQPVDISFISNKKLAFQVFERAGVPIPRYSADKSVSWTGDTVVRHKLTGHSGEGIEIVKAGEPLPDAPLYVEYIKKEDEYRVHVGKRNVLVDVEGPSTGETSIICTQRKARRLDTPDSSVNWQVRNHDNGFVYVRGGVNPPPAVMDAASRALIVSGLDFGAVDVIYNRKEGKAYVLEINTAPGVEGTTVSDYATFFSSLSSA